MTFALTASGRGATALWPVSKDDLQSWLSGQPRDVTRWVERSGFTAEAGSHLLVPGTEGALAGVLIGLGEAPGLWSLAALPAALPNGRYRLAAEWDRDTLTRATLGWALASYAYDRYRKRERNSVELVWPKGADRDHVERAAGAAYLVRDLVNTPAADLGPEELARAARRLARPHRARLAMTVGEALRKKGYPMIHAVGRGSARPPRLIDLTWGRAGAPKVTLVGKGVCFDSGGLDLKTSAGMRLMKKDMGGAATVLGVAHMVMAAGLDLRLRVLIPAVENSIGANAYRPGDVLATRKGLTVEVGNTDAEGRLVLADALAEADRERPELLIDCATLTGAARVALGPDLPALFTDDDALADDLMRMGGVVEDPLWRLPLWKPYASELESPIADLNNVSDGPFAGAVTAALFLARFVAGTKSYAHVDLYAWNGEARPGRPRGGEAMAMRAIYGVIAERYGDTGRRRASRTGT